MKTIRTIGLVKVTHVKLLFETLHLECHQQLSFTLKMHPNRWRLRLRPRPHCGSLQRSPDPLRGLKGATSKGMGKRGGELQGMGGE